MHPAELAHEVFQAWLTFALFDNAVRAHRKEPLGEYRRELAEMMAPLTEIAAANPEAWFRVARSVEEIETPTATNRMVGYPYTKFMVAIMDIDMAAALIVTSHERADTLGVPADQRVYLRGWCYATDPVYVAEHRELWRSPAMVAAATESMQRARGDRRRRRALRSLQLLRKQSELRSGCTETGDRRPPSAQRHRRAAVPRWPGQRIHDAFDRARWRVSCAPTRGRWAWSAASG